MGGGGLNLTLPAGFTLATVADERDPGGTRLVLKAAAADGGKPLELAVDFLDEKILYRLTHGFGASQSLGRALGVKKSRRPLSVLDATAGLGIDAFFMAALGCRVRALERSAVVAALLQDGYRRLSEATAEPSPEMRLPLERLRAIAENLRFENGDALEVLAAMGESERPDVIFLDPMFPEEGRSESAFPKKSMQVFRRLIGADEDTERLLTLALRRARERVVVKRPLAAPVLAGRKPSSTFAGKSLRLDLYICRP